MIKRRHDRVWGKLIPLPRLMMHVIQRMFLTSLIILGSTTSTFALENRIWLTANSINGNHPTGLLNVELWASFTEATLGGGIDLILSGPATLSSFTPADFLNNADPAFTAHDSNTINADYQIHFGDIAGLSGAHSLGTFQLAVVDSGDVNINLAINNTWGDFYSALDLQPLPVELEGTSINTISTMQVPISLFWFFALGLSLFAIAFTREDR